MIGYGRKRYARKRYGRRKKGGSIFSWIKKHHLLSRGTDFLGSALSGTRFAAAAPVLFGLSKIASHYGYGKHRRMRRGGYRKHRRIRMRMGGSTGMTTNINRMNTLVSALRRGKGRRTYRRKHMACGVKRRIRMRKNRRTGYRRRYRRRYQRSRKH